MQPRDYQQDAIDCIKNELMNGSRSTLCVMPTGTGKTIVFAFVIDEFRASNPGRRVMVLAHRGELLEQAAEKIKAVTGLDVSTEMANQYADMDWFGKTPVVVSSIQTQVAGMEGKGRMTRFPPEEFGLVIVDEAHHATTKTYRRVMDHYLQNPNCKILGVTATPNRHDERALGKVFDSVAYNYALIEAIDDGWLVEIDQQTIDVDSLDLSQVEVTAGKLNGAQLNQVMEYEENLHGIVVPMMELAGDRKTLLFTASVAQAERSAEIVNRYAMDRGYTEDIAFSVHGGTNKDERREMIQRFRDGRFQVMCNCGIATEGFDIPDIEVVAIARPTLSAPLYTQMIGRGTRPLPGLVDGLEGGAPDRVSAIKGSRKPSVLVLDFVGNAGRHKLINVVDALAGNYDDDVLEIAKEMIAESGNAENVREVLTAAQVELFKRQREQKELEEAAERKRRHGVRADVKYRKTSISPFDVFGVTPGREPGWNKGRKPSDKMVDALERFGIDNAGDLNFTHASQLIKTCIERVKTDKCRYKQARKLKEFGYDSNKFTFRQASDKIDAIAKAGWKRVDP